VPSGAFIIFVLILLVFSGKGREGFYRKIVKLIVNKSVRIILLFIFFLFSLFVRIRELHASNLYIMIYNKLTSIILVSVCSLTMVFADSISLKATKKYLNIPVSSQMERKTMTIESDGKTLRSFDIRLAADKPDYWVFCDISSFKNKKLDISFPASNEGLQKIYQSDEIAGQDSLYKERNRPQFHFSSRRGWNNDPNGPVYFEGEYHLFYQHNPYEREWGNMHWGHAVSKDLIHWKSFRKPFILTNSAPCFPDRW
jgi:hypothetical protein